MWDLGPETWHPEPTSGTRDLRPSTWDPSPETQDPEPMSGSRELGSFTWDPERETYMWDLIQGTNTSGQSKKTNFVYQSTVFCSILILTYRLKFSSQFLIIEK